MEATTTEIENEFRQANASDWKGAADASVEADKANPEVVEAGTAKRKLPCLLTDEEKIEMGAELAQTHARIDAEEEDAKASATKHRERLKELYETASAAAKVIRAGAEERLVDCRIIHDLTVGQCRVIRLDTHEVTDERALTFAERQGKLALGGETGAAHEDAEPEDASLDGEDPGSGPHECSHGIALEDFCEECVSGESPGTDITTPAALAGEEPAPKAKRSRK